MADIKNLKKVRNLVIQTKEEKKYLPKENNTCIDKRICVSNGSWEFNLVSDVTFGKSNVI